MSEETNSQKLRDAARRVQAINRLRIEVRATKAIEIADQLDSMEAEIKRLKAPQFIAAVDGDEFARITTEHGALRRALEHVVERLDLFAKLDRRFALLTENGESKWVTMGDLYAEEARLLRSTLGGES